MNQSTDHDRPESREALDAPFAPLFGVARAITQMFGQHCEVVLHDFRDPEHAVVAIEGNVTQRRVGSPVSPAVLALVAQGDAAQDRLNTVSRTVGGRVVKSSQIALRDGLGHVFGAMCINVDVTEYRMLASVLEDLAGAEPEAKQGVFSPGVFPDDAGDMIRTVLAEEETRLGYPSERLSKPERLELFRALETRGIFHLQRGVVQVAEHLGISRATAYKYLEELRQPGQ
jgi:predicted transcriptional regulator YheO